MLTQQEQDLVASTLKQSEVKTSAVIKLIILPASQAYHSYVVMYALILGSMVAMSLWTLDILEAFPWLLAIQLGVVALIDLTHSLNGFFIRFIPKTIRVKAGERAALHHYHSLHAHIPKGTGYVLLFVSLAERYVHVVTSPTVHHKIPGDWHQVTDSFTQKMRSHGLASACVATITQITDIVAPLFPAT